MKKMINIAMRSEFSFKKVFQKVRTITHDQEIAIGLADFNTTQGNISFRTACNAANIKPIYGATVNAVADTELRPKNPGQFGFEYILLAKNLAGLQEINRLLGLAYENFHYRPLVSLLDVWGLSENIIVISSSFKIPERIDYFGLSVVSDMQCAKFGLPTVALNHNYYPTPNDRQTFELFLGARGMESRTFQQHVLSTPEWFRLFKDEGAIERTHEIAEMCNTELLVAGPVTYKGYESLPVLVDRGIRERKYKVTKDVKARIKMELELIEDKKYTDYFLVVAQMTTAAKKNIMVGAGRGSAGGSLVCYLLGITEVDPLKFNLLFARFLDKHRHDAPDIDLDFPDKSRKRVINQLKRDNGGTEHVCHLGTITKIRGDSLVNQLGAELKIPFEDTIELKEIMIRRPAGDVRADWCIYDTLRETAVGREFSKKYPAAFEASKLEGHATHFGTHAAGILVCDEPITNHVGVNTRENAAMIDYRESEQLNLLKIDVLGLRTLTVLQECSELAGFDFHDYYNLDLEDKGAIEIFRSGRLTGIFQFEGMALRNINRQMQITSFDEIAAMTALGRPGPLHGGGTDKYIARQTGAEPVSYIANHPAIVDNTSETYGVIVYQEQLMHICRGVGMSWKDTGAFRRVVAKRKGLELLGTFRKSFMKAAKKSKINAVDREAIWAQMITFGAYGFNKSHAVAYAMISQNCAWAKAHHPLEFAVASLNNSKDEESAIRLLRDFVRHDGFEYDPVDPDNSDVKWTVHNGTLLGGLTNIDGIGIANARSIVAKRKRKEMNTPSIIKKLVRPETPFDILFPCEHFFGDYFLNPTKYGLDVAPTLIEDIQLKNSYTFICQLTSKRIKDLNSDAEVEKRDGNVFTDGSLVLNMTVTDDTDEIMCRINRKKFPKLAGDIIDRDDSQQRGDKHWYIIKGAIIADDIRFMFINKIHYLGEFH